MRFSARIYCVKMALAGVGLSLLMTSGCAAKQAPAAPPYPSVQSVVHSQARINGLNMHLAEAGDGPLVVLLHGFPELWFSWRHQLPVLADAGFHAVAPDMRGYGGTSRPAAQEAYDIHQLCADVIGIIEHFGETRAVLVGHDWGAAIAVQCARLHPDRVRALVTISVPYGMPSSDRLPTEIFRARFGDRFFYMLYFQQEAADRELNARPAEVFRKFFVTPGAARAAPRITDPRAAAGGFLDRIGEPQEAPDWITMEEIGYFVQVFQRTGFSGGLSYYRNLDRNSLILRHEAQAQYEGPALFIAGKQDFLIGGRTQEELETSMRAVTPRVTVALLPAVGHWTLDQAPASVNRLLLKFLARHVTHAEAPGARE